jgi:hypothetical protein
MFIQSLITIILILCFYYIIKNIIISTHELYTTENKIKYILHKSDKDYITKYGIPLEYIPKSENGVFYTNTNWSSKNNNYLLYKSKYYIVEPGYYYLVNKEITYFINKVNIIFVNLKEKK